MAVSHEYFTNLMDIIRKKKIGLRINEISRFRNKSRVSKFIYLPYSHFTIGSEKAFKNLGIEVTYKSKQTLTIFKETRKLKLRVAKSSECIRQDYNDCNGKCQGKTKELSEHGIANTWPL